MAILAGAHGSAAGAEPGSAPEGAASEPAAARPAELSIANRYIATLRARYGSADPAERVAGAKARLSELPPEELGAPVTAREITLGREHGSAVMVGERLIFAIRDGDVEAGEKRQEVAAQAARRLGEALQAWRDQRSLPLLLKSIAQAAVATAILVLAIWLLGLARRAATSWLHRVAERRTESLKRRGIDVVPLVLSVLRGSLVVVFLALLVGLLDVWLGYVLGRFPLTRPWAHAVTGWLLGLLADLGLGILQAVPGLVTAAVIFLLARLVAGFIRGLAERVRAGRVTIPGLHPETIGATRRIATAVVWLVAIAVAYPYLPGAGSEAFKGLSLLVGLMVSLGATGVVAQAMSGMVVVYSRSLARDDYVKFGDVEGVVSEVGLLSTKVVTLQGEEVTVPNNVVVAGPVRNFTRLSGGKGPLLFTKVTIGYDAPWRQVHALLLQAASRTAGLRREEPPFVLQRSLSDFYVEYELVARLEKPIERPQVLSQLHANIQDGFNEAGVQIMSPHFYAQPDRPVMVPPARWHAPPAKPDPEAGS
ncbi:MAG TPA: mechanosensitive ion channel domain-containing protein [Anaeromyxobacteraceae bacterium]|nr:mechanosensitive ion channel domain-containing protein [Anaeromyxobacteraceae bacterium]